MKEKKKKESDRNEPKKEARNCKKEIKRNKVCKEKSIANRARGNSVLYLEHKEHLQCTDSLLNENNT